MLVPSVETGLYRRELVRLLQEALSPQQYEVIVRLFGLAGDHQSYNEVAKALRIHPQAVKERRRKALAIISQRPDIVDLLRSSIPSAQVLGVIHNTSPQP